MKQMHKSPPPGRRKKQKVVLVTDTLVPARPLRGQRRQRRRRKPNWNKKKSAAKFKGKQVKNKDPFKRGKAARRKPTPAEYQDVDIAVRKPTPDAAGDSFGAAGPDADEGPQKEAEERLFLGWLFGR